MALTAIALLVIISPASGLREWNYETNNTPNIRYTTEDALNNICRCDADLCEPIDRSCARQHKYNYCLCCYQCAVGAFEKCDLLYGPRCSDGYACRTDSIQTYGVCVRPRMAARRRHGKRGGGGVHQRREVQILEAFYRNLDAAARRRKRRNQHKTNKA